MRMHIEMDDELMARVDALAGGRGRSAFVRRAVEQAVDREMRWRSLQESFGAFRDAGGGHEWDDDPAGWVQEQRRADRRRTG